MKIFGFLSLLVVLIACQNAPELSVGLHRAPASVAEVEIVAEDQDKRSIEERLQTLHETHMMVQLNTHAPLKVAVAREHILVIEKELLTLENKKLLTKKALEFTQQGKLTRASLASLLSRLGVPTRAEAIGVYELSQEARALSKRPSFQSLVTTLEHKAHLLSTKRAATELSSQFFLTKNQDSPVK